MNAKVICWKFAHPRLGVGADAGDGGGVCLDLRALLCKSRLKSTE